MRNCLDLPLALGNALLLPPLPQQRLAPLRVSVAGAGQACDPVGAKVADVLPQFAPGDDDPRGIKNPNAKGQIVRRLVSALGVPVGDGKLLFPPDRLADRRDFEVARGDPVARADQQRRRVQLVAKFGPADGGDLRQRVARRGSEPRIAAVRTQREPSASASISSIENISGGSMKPGRIT